MRSMEFRTFQNQHSGRLPDGTKILFFDNFVEFKLISREKVSDHFVKYWICDRVNQLFSFYICWQCWRTVANSVFTIFQVISGWDQFERRTRTGTTTPTLGESRKTHTYEKVSDWGPVWVRIDVIFQVPEKSNFDEPNQSQVVLLGVWNKDFTKKSYLLACVHANNPLRARAYKS